MTLGAATEFDDLEVGAIITKTELRVTREDLVRYAGASGDFNPIHFDDTVAAGEGLPGVLCQGMLTVALALQTVTEWLGDPTAVLSYETRFTRPVVVDSVHGTELSISAKIGQLDRTERTARIDLTVSAGDQRVLGKTHVRLALPS
ncbi:MaoC/PaaZ C-terminal domain-containing protein [Rhodococcus sp. NPDC047139]|uniref:MaoC/PaaZ C-terminal domain-containing protein n=1 Tax=Rhodococcus sp. NPDC047139 TaxID=3155141 RepID=UPI003400A4F3